MAVDIIVSILAIICAIFGIVGSIVPALPGPPASWVGLLLLYLIGGKDSSGEEMSLSFLLIWLAVVVVVTIVDYIVPMYFTKITGGTKYASRGALIGLILGMFTPPPLGMILCSFLGAFIAEVYYAKKNTSDALKSAFGSFLGFVFGTGIKLICCCIIFWHTIVYSWNLFF